jgi:hypothetical protein
MRAKEMVVVVKVVVVAMVNVAVVAKAMVVVEVEVVDLMTPTNFSFLNKYGTSLLVKRRCCSST